MKKLLFGAIFLSILTISCSKEGDDDEGTTSQVYLHSTSGSTWNYRTVDNAGPGTPATNYTLTSTSRDTSINGKNYHVYTNSATGESEYNGRVNNDYYLFQALPDELGGSNIENIYLKAAASANASWTQSYPITAMGFPITVKIINTIVEKGMSKTVNGTAYADVIRVKTDISITGLPPGTITLTTDINQYYAPKVGMIETSSKIDVNILGTAQSTNETTTLQSATLL
ncbi:MAG: hypothetical protein EOO07_03285 [Chitinophagaceae bacterium]|nr:MAG: hypothetical protein EOO07_03285 [Chitinophagaceae bacterium]